MTRIIASTLDGSGGLRFRRVFNVLGIAVGSKGQTLGGLGFIRLCDGGKAALGKGTRSITDFATSYGKRAPRISVPN